METQKTQIALTVFKKKNRSRDSTLPDFKQYYKALGIKTTLYWQKTHVDQLDRIESPEMNPHLSGQ